MTASVLMNSDTTVLHLSRDERTTATAPGNDRVAKVAHVQRETEMPVRVATVDVSELLTLDDEPALAHGIGGKDAAFVAASNRGDAVAFL